MPIAGYGLVAAGALLVDQIAYPVGLGKMHTVQGVAHQLRLVAALRSSALDESVKFALYGLFIIGFAAHADKRGNGAHRRGLALLYRQVGFFPEAQLGQDVGVQGQYLQLLITQRRQGHDDLLVDDAVGTLAVGSERQAVQAASL